MHNEDFLRGFEALLTPDVHPISNLCNAAAALSQHLLDVNWLGFYLLHDGLLWLGPFQGKPACTPLTPGKGVCGVSYIQNKTIIVPDVHQFPGHIACDEASRAEIVIPLHHGGMTIGVLDVDSPIIGRFTPEDQALLEKAVQIIEQHTHFAHMGYSLKGADSI